jgi:DNA-3-methyladenine glycosylase
VLKLIYSLFLPAYFMLYNKITWLLDKIEFMGRMDRSFFTRDVLEVAPDLLGKMIVIAGTAGKEKKYRITETEAYRGSEDRACHASRGNTPRTRVMFDEGGFVYVYLIYGIYWMLNVVTAVYDVPQAVLIRGIEGFNGPGKLARELGINRSFYGLDLVTSNRIWIEDDTYKPPVITGPRIGIDYAGLPWTEKEWRFMVETEEKKT